MIVWAPLYTTWTDARLNTFLNFTYWNHRYIAHSAEVCEYSFTCAVNSDTPDTHGERVNCTSARPQALRLERVP